MNDARLWGYSMNKERDKMHISEKIEDVFRGLSLTGAVTAFPHTTQLHN